MCLDLVRRDTTLTHSSVYNHDTCIDADVHYKHLMTADTLFKVKICWWFWWSRTNRGGTSPVITGLFFSAGYPVPQEKVIKWCKKSCLSLTHWRFKTKWKLCNLGQFPIYFIVCGLYIVIQWLRGYYLGYKYMSSLHGYSTKFSAKLDSMFYQAEGD